MSYNPNYLNNQCYLVVQSIVIEPKDSFFYMGVPSTQSKFTPYEPVLITGLTKDKIAPVIAYPDSKLTSGVSLSKDLAEYLCLQEGTHICASPIYNIQPIEKIKVCLSKVNSIEPIESTFTLANKLSKALRYCYITDGYTIELNGQRYTLQIKDVNKTYGQINDQTLFYCVDKLVAQGQDTGHKKAYGLLAQILQWPKFYKKQFKDLKIDIPKGVLLHGPPGCGKTHLLREVLKNSSYKVFYVRGPELLSKYVGGSESALRKIFESAKEASPSVILFDQIDAIATKRQASSEHESKLVSQLLSCMDGLTSRGQVMVLATTNMVDSLDPALRRPGRFDRQISILPPNITARKELISCFLGGLNLKKLDLNDLAHRTNGYVHADLKMLCNQAKLNVISRVRQNNQNQALELTTEDFEQAFKKIVPSLLRQYAPQKQIVTMNQVVGYEGVKERLHREITFPLRYSKIFKTNKIKPIRGIILEGPPGTGKTTLAKALSNQINYNFIFISGSQLLSKYVGQTENKITQLFNKARLAQPCMIFIDQIDGLLGGSRNQNQQGYQSSKLGTFLSQMDGATKNKEQVIIIGTTNRLDLLDPALVRAGRFELALKLDYPTKKELEQLCEFYFSPHKVTDWSKIVDLCYAKKLVGADIQSLKRVIISQVLNQVKPSELRNSESSPLILTEKEILIGLDTYIKTKSMNTDNPSNDY